MRVRVLLSALSLKPPVSMTVFYRDVKINAYNSGFGYYSVAILVSLMRRGKRKTLPSHLPSVRNTSRVSTCVSTWVGVCEILRVVSDFNSIWPTGVVLSQSVKYRLEYICQCCRLRHRCRVVLVDKRVLTVETVEEIERATQHSRNSHVHSVEAWQTDTCCCCFVCNQRISGWVERVRTRPRMRQSHQTNVARRNERPSRRLGERALHASRHSVRSRRAVLREECIERRRWARSDRWRAEAHTGGSARPRTLTTCRLLGSTQPAHLLFVILVVRLECFQRVLFKIVSRNF